VADKLDEMDAAVAGAREGIVSPDHGDEGGTGPESLDDSDDGTRDEDDEDDEDYPDDVDDEIDDMDQAGDDEDDEDSDETGLELDIEDVGTSDGEGEAGSSEIEGLELPEEESQI
jgi:hypothetical protein